MLTSSSSTSLLDLPNELLHLVFNTLNDQELLRLASTCKHINWLLTPVLFARLGLDPCALSSGVIDSITFARDNFLLLQAIGISRSVTLIKELRCELSCSIELNIAGVYLSVGKALEGLVNRLSHLGDVKFNPHFSKWRTGQDIHAIGAFLNGVAQRSDSALTVFGGNDAGSGGPPPFIHTIRKTTDGHTSTVFSSATENPSTQANTHLPLMQQLLQRVIAVIAAWFQPSHPPQTQTKQTAPPPQPETTFKSVECFSPYTPPLPACPALTTLHIHSTWLFRAHFYRWTLQLLSTAPLTTLSLDNIDLSQYDWHLIFPALRIPLLETFAIGNEVDIAVSDLIAFLARHPGIRTLNLSFHVARGSLFEPYSVQTPGPLLPRLECLRATPGYLLYFLLVNGADVHPNLHAISITSNNQSAYQIAQLEHVLACLEAHPRVVDIEVQGRLAAVVQLPESLTKKQS
ncbi:hypothetical protein C8J57DRAFT_1397300 [Mycena rebaudengoi]|nr:hypothetical protein C8J57DRAFT_1397300 [Mycena rebaudengoi]